MLTKTIQAFKDRYFKIDCPPSHLLAFEEENVQLSSQIIENISRVQLPFSILIIGLVIFLSTINGYNDFVYKIIAMHGILILINFAFKVYIKSSKKHLGLILKVLYLFILFWTLSFTLLLYPLAQDRTVFLIGLILVSVTANLPPKLTFWAFLVSWTLFLIILIFIESDEYNIISTGINLFALSAIAWLTSALFYQLRLKEFLSKIQIKEQLMELSALNNQLLSLSSTDALTGVSNRRHFDINLDALWQQALQHQTELSLAIFDLDDFKLYNDHYGHPAGDLALKRITEVIKITCIRDTDVFARFGGEEFVLILPNTNDEKANLVCERIRLQVESLKIEHQASSSGVLTISIGYKTLIPQPTIPLETMITDADKALYIAKRNGKNLVTRLD